MKAFVLDCSVAISWCFEDETTHYTTGVLDKLKNYQAIVPNLWHLEVANVLLMAERKKRITSTSVTQFINMLHALPIEVELTTHAVVFQQVLPLARACQLTSYDASYLELCVRRHLPLATLDKQLKKAAILNKVEIFET